MDLGFNVSWIGIRDQAPDDLLSTLGFERTGETTEQYDDVSLAVLDNGWSVIVFGDGASGKQHWPEFANLATDRLSFHAIDSVMHSGIEGILDGHGWSIDYESGRGSSVIGGENLPPEFAELENQAAEQQLAQDADARFPVDFHFDVPAALGQHLIGYRHDRRSPGLMYESLVPVPAQEPETRPVNLATFLDGWLRDAGWETTKASGRYLMRIDEQFSLTVAMQRSQFRRSLRNPTRLTEYVSPGIGVRCEEYQRLDASIRDQDDDPWMPSVSHGLRTFVPGAPGGFSREDYEGNQETSPAELEDYMTRALDEARKLTTRDGLQEHLRANDGVPPLMRKGIDTGARAGFLNPSVLVRQLYLGWPPGAEDILTLYQDSWNHNYPVETPKIYSPDDYAAKREEMLGEMRECVARVRAEIDRQPISGDQASEEANRRERIARRISLIARTRKLHGVSGGLKVLMAIGMLIVAALASIIWFNTVLAVSPKWQEVTGTVVPAFSEVLRSEANTSQPVIEFTVDGETYLSSRRSIRSGKLPLGSEASVLYNVDDPTRTEPIGRGSLPFFAISSAALLVPIYALFGFVRNVLLARKRRRLDVTRTAVGHSVEAKGLHLGNGIVGLTKKYRVTAINDGMEPITSDWFRSMVLVNAQEVEAVFLTRALPIYGSGRSRYLGIYDLDAESLDAIKYEHQDRILAMTGQADDVLPRLRADRRPGELIQYLLPWQ